MNDGQLKAVAYFSPSNDAAWRWTVDGEAVVWADGTTIAFKKEIEGLIARLAPGGLPRFGSIVLLLAACRDGWERSSGRRSVEGFARVFAQWQPNAQPDIPVGGSPQLFAIIARSIRSTLEQLDAVCRLPAEVRQGILAKSILAETVFEPGRKQLTPVEAAIVLGALEDGINPTALGASFTSEESLTQFARDCESLQPGLGKVDAAALALRARTGLDEPILPADLHLSAAERTCRLLDDLTHDKEFAGLARLAQKLMAAVHVPRSLHSREELPVGGVSDLANRGSLDRLLISELANDSLTLAVRVALNEALYLRRESPPRDPPHRRALLLDCGIRLWGTPRAFAIAAALAFAATTEHKAEISAFRAAGKHAEPLDLTTRAGLVSCMAALDAWPHPGDSIQPFLDAGAHDRAAPADAILITHPDVLSDPGFSSALAKSVVDVLYVATVDGDGRFEMFAITPGGRKRLSEARLDLQTLFAGQSASTKALSSRSPSLPAIWAVEPFPLRLPCVIKPTHAVATKELGLFCVSKDGRLLHWELNAHLARQLYAQLPDQSLVGIFYIRAFSCVYALFAPRRDQPARLVRHRLDSGVTNVIDLPLQAANVSGCCVTGSVLCVIAGQKIEAFSLSDGKPLGTLSLAQRSYGRFGRFFSLNAGWHALAYDGQNLLLEHVPSKSARTIMRVDNEQGDPPLTVCSDGSVLASDRADPIVAGSFGDAKPLGVSFDGGRVAVMVQGKPHVLDLQTNRPKWEPAHRPWPEALVGPQFWRSMQSPGMGPATYQGIYVNEQRQLVLVSTKQHEWMLATNQGDRCWFVQHPTKIRDARSHKRFQPVKLSGGVRIQLLRAEWADGSQVFADSRRLLHLKSSDPALPELTLVLTLEWPAVSAWCSDGRMFGSKKFLVGVEPAPDAELADIVRQFVLRLR